MATSLAQTSTSSGDNPEISHGNEAAHSEPVFLALLFTDLVDSTKMMDKYGDARAATVFRRHDEVTLTLLGQFPGGQIIDQTDGFFMIFRRPVDALQFALAYHDKLRDLSEELNIPLATRAGIAAGDVSIRKSTLQQMGQGMRPLLVDGLAKPLAARLHELAKPNQTLMSIEAYRLARRAVKGVGGDAAPIHWESHGTYIFKGIEEPTEVFEAGREGLAPFTRPENSAKGTRVEDGKVGGWRPAVGLPVPQKSPEMILERGLGEGIFGEVWLAKDPQTDEEHAFKFCYQADRLRALQKETRLIKKLKSLDERADIIQFYGASLKDPPPYYIEMEYVAGGNLMDWADREGGLRKTPLATRIDLICQIADALAAAHSVNLVHNDIKPANVLVRRRKSGALQVKLTDFGMGKEIGAENTTDMGTGTGMRLEALTGSREYRAPELFRGEQPSVKSDIYSLGVLLFQMVVGDFRTNFADLAEAVPDELLRQDIRDCLQFEPKNRLGDAAELARRLRGLDARRARIQKDQRRKFLTRWAAFAGLLFFVIAAFSGYGFWRTHQEKLAVEKEKRTIERLDYRTRIALADTQLAGINFVRLNSLLPPDFQKTVLRGWEWDRLRHVIESHQNRHKGHTRVIKALASNPEGSRIASASSDGTVRVWDVTPHAFAKIPSQTSSEEAPTQRPMVILESKNRSPLRKVVFDDAGQRIAAGAKDGRIYVWDAVDRTLKNEFGGDAQIVTGLAFSPANKTEIVTSSMDGRVRLWNIEKAETIWEKKLDVSWNISFDPEGKWIVVPGEFPTPVTILNARNGEIRKPEISIDAKGRHLARFCNGKRLITAETSAGKLKLWNVETGQLLSEHAVSNPNSKSIKINALEVQRRGSDIVVVTALAAGPVNFWKLANGSSKIEPMEQKFQGRESERITVAVDPQLKWLAFAESGDYFFRLWRAPAFEPVEFGKAPEFNDDDRVVSLTGHANQVIAVGFTSDNRHLVSSSRDNTIKRWDVSLSRDEPIKLCSHDVTAEIRASAFHPDEKLIAAGCEDGSLTCLSGHEMDELEPWPAHKSRVTALACHPNGKYVASGSREPFLQVWDVAEYMQLKNSGKSIPPDSKPPVVLRIPKDGGDFHESGVRCLAFSPDGKWLASSGRDGTVRIWKAESGVLQQKLLNSGVSAMVFSPDSSQLVCAGQDEEIRRWKVPSGDKVPFLKGHEEDVTCVAFSPDGKRIISGGDDRTLKVWDAETGHELLTLRGHKKKVTCLAFSPDGNMIASGSEDKTIRVWLSR